MTRSAIQNIGDYKLMETRKKGGPKLLINKQKSIILKRFIINENSKSFKVTSNTILNGTQLGVSRRTLNNWLQKHEYKYKKGV